MRGSRVRRWVHAPTTGAQDWVRAGIALQRVLLEATVRGLATSFLNQALEHPDLRWMVRDPLQGTGQPQTILRIGYGSEVPATPRRPVRDFQAETPGDT